MDEPSPPVDAPERIAAGERAAALREERTNREFLRACNAIVTGGFGVAAGIRILVRVAHRGGHLLDLVGGIVAVVLICGGIWLWNVNDDDSDLEQ